jgi:hypothetical protein
MKATYRHVTAAAALAALCAAAPQAWAAACTGASGFDDVQSSNQFCTNIQWIKNRGITLGCNPGGTEYCPTQAVNREQMAAFMNRLADVVIPSVLTNTAATAAVDIDRLDTDPAAHLCQVQVAAAGYPRRAIVYAQFSGLATGSLQVFATTSASVNGGAFALTAPAGIGMRAHATGAVWTNVTQTASVDLDAGSAYTLAFFVERAFEDAGSADFSEGRCNMTVQVFSRTGTSAPFDAAATGMARDNGR